MGPTGRARRRPVHVRAIITAAVAWAGCVQQPHAAAARRPSGPGRPPEASSTVLRMHKLYAVHPPHDSSLYDVLGVLPNATAAQIVKAYRRRSRDLHPDKMRLRQVQRERRKEQQRRQRRDGDGGDGIDNSDDDSEGDETDCERELAKLREAYEVLNNDQTRLPYHRFGLVDTDEAAAILTGGGSGRVPTPEQERLLRLMGYGPRHGHHCAAHTTAAQGGRHEQRVMFLAAMLVEQIRPLVEGAVSQQELGHEIARECDELKGSPLGAQILRCIGRAYRASGQRVLRQHRRRTAGGGTKPLLRVGLDLSDLAKDKWRGAKNMFEAAVAGGRLVFTEQASKVNVGKSSVGRTVQEALPTIDYHLGAFGEPPGGDTIDQPLSNDDIREQEQEKAKAAVIGALQVEALWKITKIELDRTVQEACDRMLGGGYFFFPSHQSTVPSQWGQGGDGWVGSTGEVIETDVGRLRAAAALVLVGDIMVRCSKENTSWME